METTPEPQMPSPKLSSRKPFLSLLLIAIILTAFIGGAIAGYILSYSSVNTKIETLQTQLESLPPTNATYLSYPNTLYYLDGNVSLSQLYKQVQLSVVQIRGLYTQRDMFGRLYYSTVQGSGFITQVEDQTVVVTNNHVVDGVNSITITFTDGTGYSATLLGSDPYADLAVLKLENAPSTLQTLSIVSSSSLQVGEPVIAVGSPYGLEGSVTSGIVSALGRTITEDLSGGVSIAGVIQTSTPINSGNSGGPLVNYDGQVVGITTAIVSDSQGLGFAIPSDTILREIKSLLTDGSYDKHPRLNATGIDMTFEIAKAMNTTTTYGWLVQTADSQTSLKGGTSQAVVSGSRVTIGGDTVTAINGIRITNSDDLLTYLEENTQPNQTVTLTVIRSNQQITVTVTLGTVS